MATVTYGLVLHNGLDRVTETMFDAVRNVRMKDGKIEKVTINLK